MELTNMATYISFGRSGGGGGDLINKTVYENGTFNASDDGVIGYKTFTRAPKLQRLEVLQNGYFEVEWGYDAIDPLIVNVGETHEFCPDVNYNDIAPIVELKDNQALYDLRVGYSVKPLIEDSGYKMSIYKIDTAGQRQVLYSVESQDEYSKIYVEIDDDTTGDYIIHYALAQTPGTWSTISQTDSRIIGYGGTDHGFMIRLID